MKFKISFSGCLLFFHIMPRCRCSSLVLPVLQSPAISCAALQNSTKLLSLILFVLEDSSGGAGQRTLHFSPLQYCARNLVETAKLSQRCVSKNCLTMLLSVSLWHLVCGFRVSYRTANIGVLHIFSVFNTC